MAKVASRAERDVCSGVREGASPGATSVTDKRFRRYVWLLLAAVTLAYANHFNNGFHFDDFHTIVNNGFIRSLSNIPRFFLDGTTFSSLPTNQSYRPLVSTTLAIDYFLGGGRRFFFHLSTFLVFLGQGLVMFKLFMALFDRTEAKPVNRYVALVAVAWYLLHPANAETVNYVIARSDVLSTVFILLALVMYSGRRDGWRGHLYLVPLVLGCLAKPIGVIFAPLLLLYLYLFENRGETRRARLVAALKRSAPAFAACILLLEFIKAMDPPTWRAGGSSFLHYLITQPYVLLHYFTTFFAPLSLSADTDWAPLASPGDPRFLFGILFVVALVAAAALSARARRLRPIAFGLFWFLLTLLPTSLIPLAEVMNDHRLFLPYVGLTASVCWSVHLLFEAAAARLGGRYRMDRIAVFVIFGLLIGCGYGTYVRNNVWHSEESLWRDVTLKSPKNPRGLMNYGLALMARGDYVVAESYFRKALLLAPRYPNLYVNLGIVEAETGRPQQAERNFRRAVSLSPKWPDGYYWYADFLKKQKRDVLAIHFAKKTLLLAPAYLDARKLLLSIYRESGRYDEMRRLAQQTLAIAPGDAEVARYLEAGTKEPAKTP